MNKKTIILNLIVTLLCATIVGGIYAGPSDKQGPVNGPNSYEWARDTAVDSLELPQAGNWNTQDTTSEGIIGTSVKTFTSGELTVKVSHNLNPSAAFCVTVQNSENTWSLWINQDGTIEPQ